MSRLTQAEIYLGNPNLKRANVPINFTEEQIQEYLKCKADPNVIVLVNNGEEDEVYTALTFAIESENISILLMLLGVTDLGLKVSFDKISESAFDWRKDEGSL